MRPGRPTVARIAVVVLLAGSLVALAPGPAHAGSLTPRNCTNIDSGDGLRRLSVCARGWVSDYAAYTRGVVEMHTYAFLGGSWVDALSQSITMNEAWLYRPDTGDYWTWGQDYGGNCRVNGPGGTVGCSVPNTYRVAFYGPQTPAPNWVQWQTVVWTVSWRDDRGIPHEYGGPAYWAFKSPVWSA